MKLFEIFSSVVSTRRFDDELAEFERSYKDIRSKLQEFIDFRTTADVKQSFSKKDAPYASTLAGFRHVHLVYGRVIVSYQLVPGTLRLCTITTHKALDGNVSFVNYLNGLRPSDYHPFTMLAPEGKTLDDAQKQDVVALFYDMAAQDRDILEACLADNYHDLMEFVVFVLPEEWPPAEMFEALLDAFGGKDGLKRTISKILRETSTS